MTCWQKQQTSTICQSQAEGRGGTEFALPHVCEGQKYHMTNRVKLTKKVPVLFHNLKGYESLFDNARNW